MLFSTVLIWLLIAAAFVIALPALWLLCRGLWPATAAKHQEAAARGLFVCFLLGLVPTIAGITAVTLISKLPKMGALSALLGGVLLAWGFLGAGGIASIIGGRLWQKVEPWRQTMRGGLVLISCALLPVVGWFVLLPLLAIIGWGVNVLAWFVGQPVAVQAPLPAPSAPPPLVSPPPLNVDSASA
jgi:hypothetical protein